MEDGKMSELENLVGKNKAPAGRGDYMSMMKNTAYKVGGYIKDAVAEKVELFTNPKKLYNEMKELGRKEGKPFMCYALAVEFTEDIVIPIVLSATGHPEFIPAVLAFHSEPVMYPLYFGARKMIRHFRKQKLERKSRGIQKDLGSMMQNYQKTIVYRKS